jgi:glycosyltransferase involved in cell wall biosynthesis
MRVVLLSFNFPEYCVRLAGALARDTEVLLMLPEKQTEPYASLVDRAVIFRPFPSPRLRHPIRQMKMSNALCRQIWEFCPDVIHLQQGHLWFNLALRHLPRCAFVLTVHDYRTHPGDMPSRMTPQWILSLGVRRADELIVHAEQIKKLLVGNDGIPESRVHVIPHVKLGDETSAKSDNHYAPTVLFLGRIWKYKGLEYLIRAEPLITAQVPKARIVIAGQGEKFSRYRKMMVHPERFTVHNEYLSDTRVVQLIGESTVVALPYIEASQSGVIPLAYTHRKPVVATNVGGLPEMVDEGQTGFCVSPRDEKALANAIVRILKDRHLAERLGANGNRKVNAECSPTRVAGQTLEVYRRVLHRCEIVGQETVSV